MTQTTTNDTTLLKRYEHIVGMLGELSYNLPDVIVHFDNMRLATLLESTLDGRRKNLIGLGLAIASGAEGWIEHFVIRALQSGADRQEILETIGVALLMGGGAVMKFGCEAFETLREYEARDRQYRLEAREESMESALRFAKDGAIELAAAR